MSDRSDEALRERLELASYATRGPWVKNSRSFGCVDGYGSEWHPTVESEKDKDICYLYDNDNAEDDAAHIAASSPAAARAAPAATLALRAEVERLRAENESLKNSAFEFGVVFSTKVNEMRTREEWLIRQLAQGGTWLCPMPNDYECEWRRMDSCRVSQSLNREVCWRKAAEKATREITGISGNFLENEEEKKSDGQENGN